MKKIKVAVLFGGQSSEHDISCISAATVIESIDREKYDVITVGITKDGRWIKTDNVEDIKSGKWREGKVTMILSPDRIHKGFVEIEDGKAEVTEVDVVFPVLHGLYGEDGTSREYLNLRESHTSDAVWLPQQYLWINFLPKRLLTVLRM